MLEIIIPKGSEARTRRIRNPLEVERYTTDVFFIFPFFGVLLMWICGTITILSMGKMKYEVQTQSSFWGNITEYIVEHNVSQYEMLYLLFYAFFNHSLISTSAGIVILMLSVAFALRLFRCRPEAWTKISMVYLTLHIILLLIMVVRIILNFPKRGTYDNIFTNKFKYLGYMNYSDGSHADEKKATIPVMSIDLIEIIGKNIFEIFYCIVTIRCLASVVLGDIADIFRNVFRIFYFYFRLVYFGVVVFAWQLFAMYVTAKAFTNLGELNGLAYVILFSGIYLNNCLYYYFLMVISRLTATWHWNVDDAKKRKKMIVRNSGAVARYHLGTIAFNSTIILPTLVALYAAIFGKITIRPAKCMDVLLVFYLIFNIPEYALATTAINGQNFIEATKTTYLTLTKDSQFCFSFIFIFSSAMLLMKFLIFALCGAPYLFSNFINRHFDLLYHMIEVISFFAILFSPVTLVLSGIEKANLLCTIEEDETNETSGTDDFSVTCSSRS